VLLVAERAGWSAVPMAMTATINEQPENKPLAGRCAAARSEQQLDRDSVIGIDGIDGSDEHVVEVSA
jgi:hypothetical protein